MNYFDAQNILDQRKAGAEMPDEVVNLALALTGDIEQTYTVADAMRELVRAA